MSEPTRHVSAGLQATVHTTAELVFSLVVSGRHPLADEDLRVTVDGTPVEVTEVPDLHGGRLYLVTDVPPGALQLSYEAVVSGPAQPEPDDPLDRIRYIRPSRYAESDKLAPFGFSEFQHLTGQALVEAVEAWVHTNLYYVSGASRFTDGAVDTYLARQGVCRDFAHLVIAVLRGRNVPARLVSVYAPGLRPMDFHAVAEAWVDDGPDGPGWYVVDATRLAPKEQMVRIATGRDATDTAFMTTQGGRVTFTGVSVDAHAEGAPEVPGAPLGRLR